MSKANTDGNRQDFRQGACRQPLASTPRHHRTHNMSQIGWRQGFGSRLPTQGNLTRKPVLNHPEDQGRKPRYRTTIRQGDGSTLGIGIGQALQKASRILLGTIENFSSRDLSARGMSRDHPLCKGSKKEGKGFPQEPSKTKTTTTSRTAPWQPTTKDGRRQTRRIPKNISIQRFTSCKGTCCETFHKSETRAAQNKGVTPNTTTPLLLREEKT